MSVWKSDNDIVGGTEVPVGSAELECDDIRGLFAMGKNGGRRDLLEGSSESRQVAAAIAWS